MKSILVVIFSIMTGIYAYAGDRYRIRVLQEISYSQAENYPRQWEISKYSYTNYNTGYTETRYFISASNIKHDSQLTIVRQKTKACPCSVRINGVSYFASFDDEEELEIGDSGVLKYEGNTLYFEK